MPFEIQDLVLFIAVAETGNFTAASEQVHLSQSALTRQIQNLEARIGKPLLRRTTRSVKLTTAGSFWLNRGKQLIGHARSAWNEFEAEFVLAPPKVHAGVCQTIDLAYLPGFFHAYRRHHPECHVRMEQSKEAELIEKLENCELDLVILTQPKKTPHGMEITHQFEDQFIAITPQDEESTTNAPLIQIDSSSRAGMLTREWLQQQQDFEIEPLMEFDNYDLIINAVALGLGSAIVPRRSLSIYARNRRFKRHRLKEPLKRTLCTLLRRDTNRPPHLQAFVDEILFG